VVWRWGKGGRERLQKESSRERRRPTPTRTASAGVGELRRRELEHQRGRRGAAPQRHCEKQEEGEGGETTREGARGGSATTWLWRNEAQERWARAKREGFFIIGTRPVNREKQIKQTHLHATGLTDDFWPISNTPRDRVDTANDKLFLPLPSATGLTNKTNAISPNLAHSERSNAPPRKPLE
jgi:hypothetical protein